MATSLLETRGYTLPKKGVKELSLISGSKIIKRSGGGDGPPSTTS